MLGSLAATLSAFAQNPGDHPPDAPKASAKPGDPAAADEKPADEKKDEEKSEEEDKKDEEEEETKDEEVCDFLQRLFDDSCGHNCLDDHKLKLHGFAAQSFMWNPQNPETNTNGPVTFTDRANEYQLNQLYLIFERVLDQSADEWQLGGRFDLLYGTDYFFTTARGLETEQNGTQRWNSHNGPNRTFLGPDVAALYGLALPQAYAEVAGHNWSIKAGHMYTFIGLEGVMATSNFFVTHAYTHQYGEPFTHTGVMTSYKLNDNWTIHNCIINGWDTLTTRITPSPTWGA